MKRASVSYKTIILQNKRLIKSALKIFRAIVIRTSKSVTCWIWFVYPFLSMITHISGSVVI